MPVPVVSRRLVLALAAIAPLGAALADAPDAPDIASAEGPFGSWLAEDILGGGVIDRAQTTLDIAEDGRVTGSGGCNRYMGAATIDGDRLAFGPLASTEMACAEALMNQEARFHEALSRVAAFRTVPQEQKLLLLDESGEILVRLARN